MNIKKETMTLQELYNYLKEAEDDYYLALMRSESSPKKTDRKLYEEKCDAIRDCVRNLFNSCPDAADIPQCEDFLSINYFKGDLSELINGVKVKLESQSKEITEDEKFL